MVRQYLVINPLLFSIYPINTTRIRAIDVLHADVCHEGRHVLTVVIL